MTTGSEILADTLTQYLAKVETITYPESEPIYFRSNVYYAIGRVKEHDIKKMFRKHRGFDLLSCEIKVTVKVTDESSPMFDYYVNADSQLIVSVNNDGIVSVNNVSGNVLYVAIKILAPTITK